MGTLWLEGFQKVIGKKISGLIVVQHPEAPWHQVFISFDDGTHYELYGSDIDGCKDIDQGGMPEIRKHLRGAPSATILLDATAD